MGFHSEYGLSKSHTFIANKEYNSSYLEDWLSTWHQINKGSFDQQFAANAILVNRKKYGYMYTHLIYTASQKMHQLWNCIAQKCKDRFWWYLAEIFNRLHNRVCMFHFSCRFAFCQQLQCSTANNGVSGLRLDEGQYLWWSWKSLAQSTCKQAVWGVFFRHFWWCNLGRMSIK